MAPKQPPQSAKKKKPQRVRVTNKALESRQFSTVRLPRTSEVPAQKVDVQAMYQELNEPSADRTQHNSYSNSTATNVSKSAGGSGGGAAHGSSPSSAAAAPTSSAAFDPIVHDPMFTIVAQSQYWPPPSLAELQAQTGRDHGDGFDSYDRREDDKQARKERAKVIKGELNHPRGKTRANMVVKLSDSSSSDQEEEEA